MGASTHPELLSALVRKLHMDGAVSVMRDTSSEMEEIRETLRDSQRGSRNEAIKARYHGTKDDKLAQKYLERAQNLPELTPPDDEGVCSLWVGGLTPLISKQDIQDEFYAYGEILEVKMMSERRCALVVFSMRKAAEEAAKALYRKLNVKGCQLKLWWAKSQQSKDDDEARHYGGSSSADGAQPDAMAAPGLGAPGGGRMLYPSMNPNAMGARPDHR